MKEFDINKTIEELLRKHEENKKEMEKLFDEWEEQDKRNKERNELIKKTMEEIRDELFSPDYFHFF